MDGARINVHIGSDGIPFLTRNAGVPDYKGSFPSRLRPQQVRKTRVDVFDLSSTKDFEVYSRIWDAVGMGVATVVEEDKHWVESSANWKVFIRWYVHGLMDPGELNALRLQVAKHMVGQAAHTEGETL